MSYRLQVTSSKLALAATLAFALQGVSAEQIEDKLMIVLPQEIVQATVEHSPLLRSSDQEIEAAKARQAQAAASGLPSLDLSGRAARYDGLVDSSLGPTLTIPALEERYSASATLTQPLYTGGRILNQKRSAAFQRRAAEATRRGAEADVTLQALTAYWNWSKAFRSLETLQSAVDRMQAHADDMQNLHAAGLATDNDKLATDVLLEQTRLRLEEARRRVDLARARIAFLTGQELPVHAAPKAASITADLSAASEADSLDTAMSNRTERVARQMDTSSAMAQVKAARADFFPRLSLLAGYETANPNSLFFPPADEWNDDSFVGVAVSWNIFDSGLTRAKAHEAAARAAQARLRQGQEDEGITLEVREARANLQDALERVTVAERTEQSARQNLDAATDLWQNGLARHSDVLDAHAQLTEAQYQAVVARVDALLARAGLDHAIGLLNAQHHEPDTKPFPDSLATTEP